MEQWAFVILLWLLVGVTGFAQDRVRRTVPPATEDLLTGPEWAAREARIEELRAAIRRLEAEAQAIRGRGGDPAAVERELAEKEAQKTAEFQDMGRVRDPAYAAYEPLVKERFRQHILPFCQDPQAKEPLPLTDTGALALIDELYVDLGLPSANGQLASDVRIGIQSYFDLRLPIAPSTRRILRDAVLEYVEAGGGKTSPLSENAWAFVLLRCSDPDDPAASETALELYADAQAWTEELQAPALYVKSLRRYAPAVEQRIKLREGSTAAGDLGTTGSQTEQNRPDEYDVPQLRVLVFLADGTHADERQLARVLRTCCRILESRRTSPDECAQGERLLTDIEKAQLLGSVRSWQLWADCVGALRERASVNMRQLLQKLSTDDRPPPVQRALRRALAAVERTGRGHATSQRARSEP